MRVAQIGGDKVELVAAFSVLTQVVALYKAVGSSVEDGGVIFESITFASTANTTVSVSITFLIRAANA